MSKKKKNPNPSSVPLPNLDKTNLDEDDLASPSGAQEGEFWASAPNDLGNATLDRNRVDELASNLAKSVGALDLNPKRTSELKPDERVVSIPDLDKLENRNVAEPAEIPIPKFQRPESPRERNLARSTRRFRRILDSGEAKLVFAGGRKRLWLALVILEIIACPPAGIFAAYFFKRVFDHIAEGDCDDASRSLKRTRIALVVGLGILLAVACVFLALMVARNGEMPEFFQGGE